MEKVPGSTSTFGHIDLGMNTNIGSSLVQTCHLSSWTGYIARVFFRHKMCFRIFIVAIISDNVLPCRGGNIIDVLITSITIPK